MEKKVNIKQLLVDEQVKAKLFKVIKVPQEPIKEIANTLSKIEVEGINFSETRLEIDFKVNLHITYVPQGIGELKSTFSVSFNFFQEISLENTGQDLKSKTWLHQWPRVMANIEKLVLKPQGKILQLLIFYITKVRVMGIQEVKMIGAPLLLEDVKFIGNFTIHKVYKVPTEDHCPWAIAEAFSEGINLSYLITDAGLELEIQVLAKIMGYKVSNPRLQRQYQLLEYSWQKTIEGWDSQQGIALEPQFYQLGIRISKDQVVLSFNAIVTVLSTRATAVKVNQNDLPETLKQLVIEKPIIRQRKVIEIEKELWVGSTAWLFTPEVFIRSNQQASQFLEGIICLKKMALDNQGEAEASYDYIPFKINNPFWKTPKLNTLLKAKARIKKIEHLSKEKVRCCLAVSIDYLGSLIISGNFIDR